MLPADAADPSLSIPSFGLLSSTATFVPIPVGNATVKLTRTVGNEVVYVAPPVGHGLGTSRWDKDPLGGPNGYALKLPTAEVKALVSVRHWRGVFANAFPDGCVTNRHTPAAKQLAEFARGLLTFTAGLHRAGWRLGLASPDSVYLATNDPARVFLPDVGFAWVGQMALTKPAWLSADPSDAALWGEDRKLRQFAAPEHYRTRHPATGGKPGLPAELVQQDLKTVGAILGFMLTGKLGGPEPAGAARCPVWSAIRQANAGKFVGTPDTPAAEQMLEALLTNLKAPLDLNPTLPPLAKKGGAGKWVLVAVLLLALLGGLAAWWFLTQNQPVAKGTTPVATPSSSDTPPSFKTLPPDNPPPEKLDEIIELAKKEPDHPKVLAALQSLRDEKKVLYPKARTGEVAAARRARELQDQIDQITAAQKSSEAPK